MPSSVALPSLSNAFGVPASSLPARLISTVLPAPPLISFPPTVIKPLEGIVTVALPSLSIVTVAPSPVIFLPPTVTPLSGTFNVTLPLSSTVTTVSAPALIVVPLTEAEPPAGIVTVPLSPFTVAVPSIPLTAVPPTLISSCLSSSMLPLVNSAPSADTLIKVFTSPLFLTVYSVPPIATLPFPLTVTISVWSLSSFAMLTSLSPVFLIVLPLFPVT